MKTWQKVAGGAVVGLGSLAALGYYAGGQLPDLSPDQAAPVADQPAPLELEFLPLQDSALPSKDAVEEVQEAETEEPVEYPSFLGDVVERTVNFLLPGRDGPHRSPVHVYSRKGPSKLTYLSLQSDSSLAEAKQEVEGLGGRLISIPDDAQMLLHYEGKDYTFDTRDMWADSTMRLNLSASNTESVPAVVNDYVRGFRDAFVEKFSIDDLDTIVTLTPEEDNHELLSSSDGCWTSPEAGSLDSFVLTNNEALAN